MVVELAVVALSAVVVHVALKMLTVAMFDQPFQSLLANLANVAFEYHHRGPCVIYD